MSLHLLGALTPAQHTAGRAQASGQRAVAAGQKIARSAPRLSRAVVAAGQKALGAGGQLLTRAKRPELSAGPKRELAAQAPTTVALPRGTVIITDPGRLVAASNPSPVFIPRTRGPALPPAGNLPAAAPGPRAMPRPMAAPRVPSGPQMASPAPRGGAAQPRRAHVGNDLPAGEGPALPQPDPQQADASADLADAAAQAADFVAEVQAVRDQLPPDSPLAGVGANILATFDFLFSGPLERALSSGATQWTQGLIEALQGVMAQRNDSPPAGVWAWMADVDAYLQSLPPADDPSTQIAPTDPGTQPATSNPAPATSPPPVDPGAGATTDPGYDGSGINPFDAGEGGGEEGEGEWYEDAPAPYEDEGYEAEGYGDGGGYEDDGYAEDPYADPFGDEGESTYADPFAEEGEGFDMVGRGGRGGGGRGGHGGHHHHGGRGRRGGGFWYGPGVLVVDDLDDGDGFTLDEVADAAARRLRDRGALELLGARHVVGVDDLIQSAAEATRPYHQTFTVDSKKRADDAQGNGIYLLHGKGNAAPFVPGLFLYTPDGITWDIVSIDPDKQGLTVSKKRDEVSFAAWLTGDWSKLTGDVTVVMNKTPAAKAAEGIEQAEDALAPIKKALPWVVGGMIVLGVGSIAAPLVAPMIARRALAGAMARR